jgi:NAD(P)-dependent dehydrogenase (short-subunit alcohol dehydrogenase family)
VVVLDLPAARGSVERDGFAFAAADVRDSDAVGDAVSLAMSRGDLRVAVNCAGIGPPGRVLRKGEPLALDAFSNVVEVNLIGTFNVIRLAAAAIAKAEPVDGGRGVIVNTASIAAFDGQIGQAAYSSSKGGIVGMTLPVARDLAAIAVRVNTVAPGLIDTPIYGEGEQAEALKAKLGESVLFPRRLGSPDELASMVMECLTNSYMNGAVVRVDGGIRMPPK